MSNEFPGVFGVEHILFLVVFITLSIFGIYLIRKYAKSENTRNIIVKVSALILLLCIIANRVSIVVINRNNRPEGFSWLHLIPDTFCGMSSLVFSLSVLFGKDDNLVYHFIVYFGFYGGVSTLIYPTFLDNQTFWDLRSFTGLLHHAMMIWMTILLISTGKFRPDVNKWFIFPIGYSFVMLFGLFEIDALGFNGAMNISEPLIDFLPHLSTWYVVGVLATLLTVIISFFWNKKVIKSKCQRKTDDKQ